MLGDDWHPQGYELYKNGTGFWELHNDLDPNWPWTDGLRHLVASIENGTPDVITPEHGYHVLEIMLKAEEAGRTGMTQTIESTFPPVQAENYTGPKTSIHDPTRTED